MSASRRSFLAAAGTFLAGAVVSPLSASRKDKESDWINGLPQVEFTALDYYTAGTFRPLVGTRFVASDSEGKRLILRLSAVESLPEPRIRTKSKQDAPRHGAIRLMPAGRPAKLDSRQFSLRLKYVSGPILEQGTYEFFHSQLGTFLMFVVPSAATGKPSYTATFNQQ